MVRELPSPDSLWLLGISDENLRLRSTKDGSTVRLTADGIKDYEWVGRHSGWPGPWAVWSPDGSRIVVKKTDYRKVPKVSIPCYADGGEDVRWMPYPTGDQPLPATELHILSIPNAQRVSIDMGAEPDQYYVDILGWQTDGSTVFFARFHRMGTAVELMAADPATGSTERLYRERSEVPIWPQFTLLADGTRFVRLAPARWVSDSNGEARLYLHDRDGRLIRALTPDTLLAGSVIGLDEVAGWVYWTGRTRDPRADHHLYRVRLDGTGLVRLTEGVGWHEIQVSPSKRFFIDNHSSTGRPPSAELRSVEGTLLQTLSTADITNLEDLDWRRPEEFVVKAADGTTDNFGVLYRPTDFDPRERYPVIELIYAHPTVRDTPRVFFEPWATYVQAQALAQITHRTFPSRRTFAATSY